MRNPFLILEIIKSIPAESIRAHLLRFLAESQVLWVREQRTLVPIAAVFAILLLAVAWIITLRVRVRRETRFLRATLAEQVALREASESASKVKGEFLANMSHEIRTPMNAIMGFTDLVLKTQLSSELREDLDTVRTSAEWLMHIVNDVLEFSRVEAGGLQLDSKEFSLAECIRSTMRIVQREAAAKSLVLRFKIDPQIPALVRSDPTRLQQIVFNLLDNAVKFTSTGSVLVSAVLESKSADSVLVRISVADTGIGMPPGRQQFIFEPFRQAEGSAAISNPSGTGLGLAICRKLVTLFGGTIEVQSQLGAGSTFEFTAWFHKAGGSVELDQESKISRTVGARRLSILIAEDNAVNRRLVTKVLESAGHQVTAAANGKEAVQMFGAEDFELIFMDIEMPEMDGYEATEAIRTAEQEGSHIPIYALTAHVTTGDRERCIAAGMDGYISKPIEVDEVLNIIAAVASLPPRLEAVLVG